MAESISVNMSQYAICQVAQKYPTGQNAISRQHNQILICKFPYLYRKDPATILKMFNKLFYFPPKLLLFKYFMPSAFTCAVYAIVKSMRHAAEG